MQLTISAGQASPIIKEIGVGLMFDPSRSRMFLSDATSVEVTVAPGAYLVVNSDSSSFFEALGESNVETEGNSASVQVANTGSMNTLALKPGTTLTISDNLGVILDQREFPSPAKLIVADALIRSSELRQKILAMA
jgi:hypothetical protein